MTRPQPPRTTALLVVAVVAITGVTGCGGRDKPPSTRLVGGTSGAATNDDGIELVAPGGAGAPRGRLPAVGSVDQADPAQVADAATITNYTVDTRVDTSPMDGLRRARRWLSPDYAAAVAQPMPAGGGADWIELAQADGYTTATVTASDETRGGKRTNTTAVLARIATITRHDRNGRALGTEDVGAFITLTRTSNDAPWRITQITTG